MILPQVTFGIAIRMAVMSILAGQLTMKIHIKNGRLIDPGERHRRQAGRLHRRRQDRRRSAQRPDGFTANRTHRRDAASSSCPGLVDLSARLREPGFEYMATLESEMQAAVPAA